MTTDAVRDTPPTEREVALKVVGAVASLAPGELASLRRLDADTVQAPAFWRIVATLLDAQLPATEPYRREAEGRWAVAVAAMATAKGFHSPKVRLGTALAGVVDERRVLQLLRARGNALADGVRMVVHHLVSKGVAFDQSDLARLVLSDGRGDEEAVRRDVYRFFFAAQPRD